MSVDISGKGLDDILAIAKASEDLTGKSLDVGVLEGSGSYPNGSTVVEVATYFEFGTRSQPARPFVRNTFDRESESIEKLVTKTLDAAVSGKPVLPSMQNTGKQIVSKIRDTIYTKDGLSANAPSTVDKKGFDLPGIDSGKLLSKISYKING